MDKAGHGLNGMLQAVRNTVGAGLLIGLAVATWLLGRPTPPEERPSRSQGGDVTHYYLKNATLYGTDSNGQVFYQLRAGRVEQPADGGPLQFSDLTLEYDAETNVHWRLTATAGRTGAERSTLLLSDGVMLESTDTSRVDATTIEAATLTLNTLDSSATTPDRVSLAHGQTRFQATGLTADLQQDRIDLHSDVSANLHR